MEAIGCPLAIALRPPPDPWTAEHPIDPRGNRDASRYFARCGICVPCSGATAPHVGSDRGGSPGSAAPLHAVTGDAHQGRSQRNRCGLDRNRCRRAPGRDSLGPRREKAGRAAGHHDRNCRSHHAPADGVDTRCRSCEDAPAIVPLHGVGRGAEAELPRHESAPCLPSNPGEFYRTNCNAHRSEPPRTATARNCPDGSTGTSRPLFAALSRITLIVRRGHAF